MDFDASIGTRVMDGGVGTAKRQPSLERPVSQACTQAQFDTPIYRYWCGEIRETPRYHRKQWEFCYILQALTVTGALREGNRGLGFGVGTEPLTAVLAAHGCRIVATDLDSDEAARAGWVDTNQHASQLAALNTHGICDPKRFAANVRFRVVDMNHIPVELMDFDFTWSACCLEHLGSIRNGLAFIENSLAALRPGGIAVHTTELNCSSNTATLDSGGTVLFRKRDIEYLCERLRQAGHEVETNFHLGEQPLDDYVDAPPYSSDRHLKLRIAQYTTTSFGLIVRKGSNSKPIMRTQIPTIQQAPATRSRRSRLKERVAAFLRWQAEVGSRSTQVLGELAALRQEVSTLRQELTGSSAEAGPRARPFYYLGSNWALTQLSTGDPFFVNTRDRGITSWIVRGGIWETFVDDVLCALARPGQTVVDVGANQGYYTVKLAQLVGETGAVYSFEPNPELYSVLAQNVSINGLSSRVQTYRLAAGEAPGQSVLHFSYDNMGGGHVAVPGEQPDSMERRDGGSVAVEIARVDDILPAGTVADVIKIDAEGYEPLVLRGMRETLDRSSGAAIVLEVAVAAWARFGDPMALLEQVRGARNAYWIGHDGRLTPVTFDGTAEWLSPDSVSYVLLLPPDPQWKATVAGFLR